MSHLNDIHPVQAHTYVLFKFEHVLPHKIRLLIVHDSIVFQFWIFADLSCLVNYLPAITIGLSVVLISSFLEDNSSQIQSFVSFINLSKSSELTSLIIDVYMPTNVL